jgi:hypothetical protein
MSPDFFEMLSALSDAEAEFLVVGAHALAVHGRPRATGDLDIWIRTTPENVSRVWTALAEFGAPMENVSEDELTHPDMVFQFGVSPNRIDILTSLSGLVFEEAWARRVTVEIQSLPVPVLGREDLIRNKRAVGRPRDLADLAELEADA